MAIPDPLSRRELLHSRQKRPVDFAAVGEEYLAKGRLSDALDFFDKVADAGEREKRIAKVRDLALGLGDAFLLGRVNALVPLKKDDWQRGLEKARSLGKTRHALRCARGAGDEAEVARLELELGLRAPEPAASAAGPETQPETPEGTPPETNEAAP